MKFAALVVAVACAPAFAQEYANGWWHEREVTFQIVNGWAVAQGDIVLGRATEIPADRPGSDKTDRRDAVGTNSKDLFWPDGVIPYVIDPTLTNQKRVTDAVEHWNANTPIRLAARTDQANYVRFVRASGECSSRLGMVGGEQLVNLADYCETGSVIHEIGHVAGLFHEQARVDRDFWIESLPQNADKRALANFAQALSQGQDIGAYDFASIMHYDVTSASRNGKPVVQTIPAGIPIGQHIGLSPADIEAVRRLYSAPASGTTITTFPFGLDVTVDGERFKAPRTFQWNPGSQHTVSVSGPQGSGRVRYVFGRWSDEGEATHTIMASADTTVYTANFVQQYQLPLAVSPASAGRIEITPASPDGWYTNGVEVAIRAVPADGWNFVQWTGFGMFGTHGASPMPLRTVILGTDQTYTANFSTQPVTLIQSEPPGLRVLVDGTSIVAPRGYVWASGSSHTLNVDAATQTANGGTSRHQWSNWSDDGARSHSVTGGTQSATVTARFSTQFNVSARASSTGQVQLVPEVEGGFYDAGSTVTLRPVPRGTNRFVSCGTDATGSSDPGSLVVDDQKLASATFGTPGQININGIVNAASYAFPQAVVPGTVVTLFGVDIGPETLQTLQVSGDRVSTTIAGYRLMFDEFPAPLIYVARNQISAVVPFGVAGRTDTVLRLTGPGVANAGRIPVIASNPGLFTLDSSGVGPAAALNEDGSVNSATNPAAKGSVMVLYGTGTGVNSPAVADGQIVSGSSLPRPVAPVRVRVAGQPARVLYAGGAPGLVAGVVQINVQIPADCPSGAVAVNVGAGSGASPSGVTLFVQ